MNKGHNNKQQQQREWPSTWAPLLSHVGFEIHMYSIIIKKKIERNYINNMAWSVQPEKKMDDARKMYYSSRKV